jgi:hypothetical protein
MDELEMCLLSPHDMAQRWSEIYITPKNIQIKEIRL